jgi:lysophospholipase L1-like esterase
MKIYDIIREADEAAKFYAVGDSHAEGVANYGGKNWISKAFRGTSSVSPNISTTANPKHIDAIDSIPKGSTVAICLGCNDAANAALAKQQGGKTLTPEQVADNVKRIVDYAVGKGLKVVFVLYPVSTKKDAYGSPYSQKCREAISSAITSVPVVDMSTAETYDGVHANGPDYAKAAKLVEKEKPLATSPAQKGSGDPVADNQLTKLAIPGSRMNPEIADIQKVLIALGYDCGPPGVDGIRGPYTSSAIKKFQGANGLQVDGDPGPETVGALNNILASKPEISNKLVKSTIADVKSRHAGRFDNIAVGDLIDNNNPRIQQAREAAEKYLGRTLKDEEWTALVKVTAAEESTVSGCGHVMAAILNRVNKGSWGNTVMSVVSAPSQFQPVTGTKNQKGPGISGLPLPGGARLGTVVNGAINVMPTVSHNIINFTSNIDAAYGPGTNINYKKQLLAKGGVIQGQSVFSA